MSLNSLMNVTVTVRTKARTRSPTGGSQPTWTQQRTGVPCRTELLTADAAMRRAAIRTGKTRLFMFAADPQLTQEMGVQFEGELYVVKSVDNVAGMNRLWEVIGVYDKGAT